MLTHYIKGDYDLENSYVIGDRLTDVKLAKNLGSQAIYLNKEACDDAADCYDWDDEDVINFDAESDLIETSRDMRDICYLTEKQDWVEVPTEIQDYSCAKISPSVSIR